MTKKRILFFLIIVLITVTLNVLFNHNSKKQNSILKNNEVLLKGVNNMIVVNIEVNGKTFLANFYNNELTQVLLEKMPLTLEMEDYAKQEKVVYLPYSFPKAKTSKPNTIKKGEIYLWSENHLVLFYTTFNNNYGGYVPVGYIEDSNDLANTLGNKNVNVTFSIQK